MVTYTASTRLSNILASTLEKIRPQMTEHIIKEIPLFKMMDKHGSKVTLDGGERYTYPLLCGGQAATWYDPKSQAVPVNYGGGNAFQPTALGGATYNLPAVPIMVAGQNHWSYLQNQIAISGDEKMQNMGEAAIQSLIKGKLRAAQLHIANALNTVLFTQQTASTAREFISLQAVAPPTAADLLSNTGADTHLCSGVAYNNSSFNLVSWKNQYVLGQADYTDLLDKFLDLKMALQMEGAFKTNVICMHSAIYKKYELMAANNLKFMKIDDLDFGFAEATYKGIPIIVDDLCLHGTGNNLGHTDECAYFLNLDTLGFFTHKLRDIEIGELKPHPAWVDIDIAQMKWMGGTWCSNRRAQGIALFNS